MAERYDVVIVGGGPAGLMAARTIGQRGLKAALLERKHDIPKIHRSCGGVLNINEPTFGEMVRFEEEKQQFRFETLGFSIPYSGPYQNVYGFHIYSPGGRRFEFGNFEQLRRDPARNRLGVATSKEQLLRGLLEESQGAGVKVLGNTNVAAARVQAGGVVIECDDGRAFEGRMVIAADGINSRIARTLGLNRQRDFYGTSRDASLAIQGTDCPDPDGFLFMITGKGIFSMIPLAEKDCYHIYASTYRREVKPRELLEYFVTQDKTFSSWYKRSRRIDAHRTACVVSLMSPMEKPFKDNVLFIGDACWRREMSNVGSLCTGYKAGTCVADAFAKGQVNEQGLGDYFAWYGENFYAREGKRKQGGRDFTDYLTPDDIDYLASLPEEPFPHTMDIFKVVGCIGKSFGELMTRIYEERPDTMDRMIQVRENMDDDLQKRIKWGFRIA
jgi:flavin-dependent dehydrogenase